VEFAQACEHGLSAYAEPAAAWATQPMMYDHVRGAFDRAAADWVTLVTTMGIAHSFLIRADAFGCFLHDGWPRRLRQIQALQGGDYLSDLIAPQTV
jgi:hypothetical protein